MNRLAIIALVAACSMPPLKLELAMSSSPDKSCNADTCADVHLDCPSVASIRILDPAQPSAPFISQCENILFSSKHDLCSLAQLSLDQIPLPEQTLEVQVVVYPASEIPTDPVTGDLICPTEREGLMFDAATGFPSGNIVMQDPVTPSLMHYITPAIGGRAFYHPGDDATVVALGCNDLGAINACSNAGTTVVKATVLDFDNQQSLGDGIAGRLAVSVGEPKPSFAIGQTHYELLPGDVHELGRTVIHPPVWGDTVDLLFTASACIEVLEDGAMTTASLTCKRTLPGTSLNITAIRLAKFTLDTITQAFGNPTGALDNGLVVGIVIDFAGAPVTASTTVTTSGPPTSNGFAPAIEYLSGDRLTLSDTPGAFSGVFISRDAPFGTTFSTANTAGATTSTVTAYGGLVDGKVTIVVLQLAKVPTNQ